MRIDTPQKLRLWREGRKLTQAAAAKLFRVGHRTYRGWEMDEVTIPGPAQVAAEMMALAETDRTILEMIRARADAALEVHVQQCGMRVEP